MPRSAPTSATISRSANRCSFVTLLAQCLHSTIQTTSNPTWRDLTKTSTPWAVRTPSTMKSVMASRPRLPKNLATSSRYSNQLLVIERSLGLCQPGEVGFKRLTRDAHETRHSACRWCRHERKLNTVGTGFSHAQPRSKMGSNQATECGEL